MLKKSNFLQAGAVALATLTISGLARAQAVTPIKFQLDWRFEGPSALFLSPAAKGYFRDAKLVRQAPSEGFAKNKNWMEASAPWLLLVLLVLVLQLLCAVQEVSELGDVLHALEAMAMVMYEFFSVVEKHTTAWAHRGSQGH